MRALPAFWSICGNGMRIMRRDGLRHYLGLCHHIGGIIMTWVRIAATVAMAAVAIAIWSFVAHAHPAGVPQDGSELSMWFERQHNIDGGVCCGSYDAFYLADDDWVMTAHGYRVHLGDGWYDVPPSKLRDTAGGPNPTGQAIIWYAQAGAETPVIWCFAPGTTY